MSPGGGLFPSAASQRHASATSWEENGVEVCSTVSGLSASDAFASELVELRPRLVAYARGLAGDPDESEDLVQETLVRAVAARGSFRPASNLQAWLFSILRNVHRNRRRAQHRHPGSVPLDDAEDWLATPAVDVAVVERSEVSDVLHALHNLPPGFAEPLRLLAVEELSYSEIAQALEIPIGTVMSRIYRARRLLAECINEP